MPAITERGNPITRSKLTPKQAIFVKEYVKNNGNASAAAVKAYNTNDINTAAVIGCENLRKVNVYEEIQQAARELQLTPKFVLGNLQDVLTQRLNLSVVVSSAQVINDMTGWKAPVKIDNTHRIGDPEEALMQRFD